MLPRTDSDGAPETGRAPHWVAPTERQPPGGRLRGSANRVIGVHGVIGVGEPRAAPVPLATAPSVEPIRSHQVCAWKPGSGRPAQRAARGSPTTAGNALSPRSTPHPGRWPAQWRAGAGRNGEEAGGACEPIYRAAPRADCNLPLQWTIVPTPNTRYSDCWRMKARMSSICCSLMSTSVSGPGGAA
jgi:hypothetical protein